MDLIPEQIKEFFLPVHPCGTLKPPERLTPQIGSEPNGNFEHNLGAGAVEIGRIIRPEVI